MSNAMTERTFTAAEMRVTGADELLLCDGTCECETQPCSRAVVDAMLRQGAKAIERWEQLKADVSKTAADYAADIEINTYRSGQKAHAKAVLDEMARLEKERTA